MLWCFFCKGRGGAALVRKEKGKLLAPCTLHLLLLYSLLDLTFDTVKHNVLVEHLKFSWQ